MHLYFFRHGPAEEYLSDGQDRDRRLTEEGRAITFRAAQGIVTLSPDIELILSSPYPRALETAQLMVEASAPITLPLAIEPRLAADRFHPYLLKDIISEKQGVKSLMLVGHEPGLSMAVAYLTGGLVRMKKAGIACVETDSIAPGAGRLLWLLTSRQLEKLHWTSSAERPNP